MKREYSKPDILFESFSLSTSIAGTCAKDTNTQTQNVCSVYLPGVGNAFLENIFGCKTENGGIPVQTDGVGGVCYHVPTPLNNLFMS